MKQEVFAHAMEVELHSSVRTYLANRGQYLEDPTVTWLGMPLPNITVHKLISTPVVVLLSFASFSL
eukprot:11186148-Lingulodinium_polyedra.AAC.1